LKKRAILLDIRFGRGHRVESRWRCGALTAAATAVAVDRSSFVVRRAQAWRLELLIFLFLPGGL